MYDGPDGIFEDFCDDWYDIPLDDREEQYPLSEEELYWDDLIWLDELDDWDDHEQEF